jgi:cytochrome c-type biogenesis protein CcmF
MDEIQYVGEHLLPGIIGKISVLTTFIFAFTATVAYFIAAQQKEQPLADSWKRYARISFGIHALGIAGIIGALFFIIQQHLFEYHYAWQHSSRALPPKYLLSCFWEGQEGSFLLWMFWHGVLGFVLMWKAKEWESPVMAMVAITQVFLGSMLLGFSFGETKIGSNPFNLLREVMDAPIFARANYLEFVKDGNGLNPLLQNYWMVIHPPTLFLGFASTIVPFAYSIAAFWKNDFSGWVKPVLPWTLFSAMILGIGILMGGAWAYEALSFGGFWAWDPVENASLVPWITLIAGLHTLIIYKSTGHSLRATFVFFISTFVLILYSTFLTRSGILGDTSVHSFTDLGMSGQLLFFMAFFLLLSFGLIIVYWKRIPNPTKEEEFSSREFWMFIGALVLTISAIQITFTTSIPVWNKFFPLLRQVPVIGNMFDKDLAPPVDAIKHYNSVQVWIAVLISLISAFVQYLRYKQSKWSELFKVLTIYFVLSLLLSAGAGYALDILKPHYFLMLFATVFTVVCNAAYIFSALKGKVKVAGGSVAHIGFGLLLLGALISQHNQQVISINKSGVDYGDAFDDKSKLENILLRRDEPVEMSGYDVTFIGDSTSEPNTFYKVKYKRIDENGNTTEEFTLLPNAQINPNMGLISSPDTRHYLTKDIYTHVTSVPDKNKMAEDNLKFEQDTVMVGDTFFTAKAFVVVDKLMPNPPLAGMEPQPNDIGVGIPLKAQTLEGNTYEALPVFLIRDNTVLMVNDTIPEIGVTFRVERILPETQQIVIGKREKDFENDFVIMKAIVFPYINILWLGCIVMSIGFLIGILRRAKENKAKAA